jgi:hypothetical protein
MKRIYRTSFLCLTCVVVFNILITSATVFLHEISHFLAGIYFGCKEIRVVLIEYPNLKAYTEMKCQPNIQYIFPALAPLILISSFSTLFLSLKNLPEKNFCWIIIGFNLIISISDMLQFIPTFLIYLQSIMGILLVISGQYLFINGIILLFIRRR